MERIYAVVLAAGSSTRLGFNKLFVRIDGETVLKRSVRPFLTDFIDKVIVVTGEGKELVDNELRDLGCEVIYNPHHLQGMSSSIKAALPHITGADAAFFHLGDKPFTGENVPALMKDTFIRRSCNILMPVWQGRKGHPVLMRIKPFMDEMAYLSGDKGLREVIENHLPDVVFIEGDEGTVFDIDTIDHITFLRQRGHIVEES